MKNSVFMIGWEYPPHNSGGLGVACQGLTQALAQEGQELYFTLPYQLAQPVSHMQVVGCYDPAWATGGTPSQAPFLAYSTTSAPLHSAKSQIAAAELPALPQSELEQRVSQYADKVTQTADTHKSEFEGIHAHDWMSFPAATQIKQQLGKPMIAHVHSTEFDRIPNGQGSQYIHQTEYQGLHKADLVIAVSNYTKRLIVDRYGLEPSKIEVVHNGIDPLSGQQRRVSPAFAPDRPVVVFMGRLTMQKGADQFLELARAVIDQLPSALFVVAGSGDQFTSLLLRNAGMQLSAHLLFTGFLRGGQREDLLNRADVFVMPSLSEPFGLVALEAAQRHTPVIVSSNSGVAEVMPSAIVTDFWDVDRMRDQIVELVNNRRYHRQVAMGQHQEVAQLSWQESAKKVRSIYRRVFTGETPQK